MFGIGKKAKKVKQNKIQVEAKNDTENQLDNNNIEKTESSSLDIQPEIVSVKEEKKSTKLSTPEDFLF